MFYYFTLRSCAVFKLHRGGLAKFRWRIAKGRHLFPFRTEQLSLSAPMVLGGQPPGRVGRRRFFLAVRAGNWRGLRRPISGALSHDHGARVALLRHAPRSRLIACCSNASLPRQFPARTAEACFLEQVALG